MEKMLALFVVNLVLFCAVASAASSSFEWHKFKRDYHKKYASPREEAMRKQVFLENINQMRAYQRAHPNATFTLAINHLADRRSEEFMTGSEVYFDVRSTASQNFIKPTGLPDSLDWRTKGVITPVRNTAHSPLVPQGAAVELVESLHAIQTHNLEKGSIARLDDCCPYDFDPFQCMIKLGGLCRAVDYPELTGQCVPNKCQPFTRFNKIKVLKTQNEDTMVTWIQDSTLYSAIDASSMTFRMYKGGIYQDASCSSSVVGRRVQLVGYGKSDSDELFWVAKNSLGEDWGENGYMRILRGKNMCGIATQVIQVA